MTQGKTETIRNIALLGHSGAGKTLLFERLLVKAGVIGEMGSLERGTTVSDHDPLEREYGHSLNSAISSFEFEGHLFNLLDTPGDPDFRGQALAAMGAAETAAIVVNAAAGIESSTRRLMRRARQRKRCRVLVINQMDVEGADLTQLVRDIRSEFGNECLPINLPTQGGATVRDCFFKTDGETDIFSVAAAHTEILDQVVEVDEELMARYLEGEEIEAETLRMAFGKALRQGHLVPICFTSAETGAGCGEFLRFAMRLLPDPLTGNPPPVRRGPERERITLDSSPPDAVFAHVFKVINDPYAGKLSVFRVYQGTLQADASLQVGEGRRPIRAGHLYRLHGNTLAEVKEVVAGEICALAKVDEVEYDDILHNQPDQGHVYLKPMDFSQPMFGLAVTAARRGDEQKLATGLARLAEEDPCFVVEHSQELNETIMRGLGEKHLRVMLDRLKARYKVEVNTSTPGIAYRETITRAGEGHCRHKKQTGGAGQFGEVFMRVRPLARGEGFVFRSEVVGGAIPTSLIPAVEKGVRQVLEEGAIAGYPLQDLEAVVYDGKYHSVDSKEIAFVIAGRKAFLDAIATAGLQVLEPIVELEATVPDANMGDVTGLLASRRARIQGTDSQRSGSTIISAMVPLSVLSEFPTELKSLTGGEGRYTMGFSHYEAVPAAEQAELVRKFSAPDPG